MRYQVQVNLEDYVSDKLYTRGRFGQIMLVIPKLQSITQQMIEVVHVARAYGVVKVDNLLHEMLLGGKSILLFCHIIRIIPAPHSMRLPGNWPPEFPL